MTEEREFRLMSCKSISEFLTMFFGLGKKEKQSVFSERMLIKKGTELYRIRRAKSFDNQNIYDAKEWGPVPKEFARQGRFNLNGQSVLYVASSTEYLGREVGLEDGEEYYLAKYICNNSFYVGTFLSTNNYVNALMHKITMSVADDKSLTLGEKALLDDYFNVKEFSSLCEIAFNQLASLFLYRLIPDLYEVTNKLGRIVMEKNECGIRYSSVYVPFEFSGGKRILTLDGVEYGNYVLTEKGCENMELVSVEKKKYESDSDLSTFIKVFIEEEQNDLGSNNTTEILQKSDLHHYTY